MSTYDELIEKGRRLGLEQGEEKGLEAARKLIRVQLEQKFGPLPDELAERLRTASPRQLEAWGRRVVPAKKVGDVFERPASRRSKKPRGRRPE